MSYDKSGLGISELAFIAVNYPETYSMIENLDPILMLDIAHKFIQAFNNGLVNPN